MRMQVLATIAATPRPSPDARLWPTLALAIALVRPGVSEPDPDAPYVAEAVASTAPEDLRMQSCADLGPGTRPLLCVPRGIEACSGCGVADYAPAMGRPGIFAAARPVVRRDFVRPMSPWRSVVLGDEFV